MARDIVYWGSAWKDELPKSPMGHPGNAQMLAPRLIAVQSSSLKRPNEHSLLDSRHDSRSACPTIDPHVILID